jgi:uncharacterized membrane-anchored protein YitT (DUF2179 family)
MSNHHPILWKQIFSLRSLLYLVFGVASAVVALKGLLIPNEFLDGGITGISILLYKTLKWPMELFLLVLNIPFLILGYKKIGKTFAIQSFIAILLLITAMHFVEIPTMTEDKVLIAVFGGVFIGLGIGLVIRSGGVIDGFEVLADYTDKISSFKATEIILFLNTLLFLSVAYFFGIESVMYSILTYFTAAKTTDYVVDGFEQYISLNIISQKEDEVKSTIVNDFGKAITIYKGERGYLPDSFEEHYDCDIIVTVVTRLELYRVKRAVREIDGSAFFFVSTIREVSGGVVKQKAHH